MHTLPWLPLLQATPLQLYDGTGLTLVAEQVKVTGIVPSVTIGCGPEMERSALDGPSENRLACTACLSCR